MPTLLLLFLLPLALASSKVVFVAEMCRHGSRAPTSFLPWDTDGRWAIGAGELTSVGERQHFLLGSELRQRYIVSSPALLTTYNATQLYLRSTDYNRTLMSAQSQMMGLFPTPTGPSLPADQSFTAVPPIAVRDKSKIISSMNGAAVPNKWQVLPVHTVPDLEDYVLQAADACKLLVSNVDTLYASQQALAIANSNPLVTQTISQVLNVSNPASYVSGVVDSVKCNLAMGFSVPAALQGTQFWTGATQVSDQLFALRYQSDQNARLYSSGFFLDLIYHFTALQKGTEPTKFRLYSAHDDTVAGILAGLKAYNNTQPPFASSLIFEVTEQNYALFVSVRYNDQELQVANCTAPCPLGQFISFLQQRAYPNIQAVCSASAPVLSPRHVFSLLPAAGVFTVLGLALFTYRRSPHKPLVSNP